MKIRYVLVFIVSFFALPLLGQVHSFGVWVGDVRIGKYTQSSEPTASLINTFSSLEVKFNKLTDTTSFKQNVVFTEDLLGNLKSVSSITVFKDTSRYLALFNPDSLMESHSKDTLILRDSVPILGPIAIQKLCKQNMDSIGASVSYRTFVPELKMIAKIHKKNKSLSIENAQRIWTVEKLINDQSISIWKYDQYFNLVGIEGSSAFGEIVFKKINPKDTIQQLFSEERYNMNVKSNTFLPDPKNINALEVKFSYDDTTQIFTLADNSFEPVSIDSLTEKEYVSDFKWIGFENSDSIIRILKSIRLQRDTYLSKLKKLYKLSRSLSKNSRFNNIKLAQFGRMVRIPTRLVKGFYYDQGYWHYHLWVEVGLDEEWLPFDAGTEFQLNRALRLPISHSDSHDLLLFGKPPFSLSDSVTITITEFLQKNRSHKLKKANHDPVEFKNGRYINHALGISFDIPNNYKITNSKKGEILTLTNPWKESFVVEQMVSLDENINFAMKKYIIDFSLAETSDIQRHNKTGSIYTIGHDRAVLARPQGDSYYVIKVHSEDPKDMIDFLLQKNISFTF